MEYLILRSIFTMKKIIQYSAFFVFLIFSIFTINAFTNKDTGRTFLIKQNDNQLAKVNIVEFPDRIEATVQRKGQAAHTYTTYLKTSTTDIIIGDKEVLSVNSKVGRIITPDSDSLTKNSTWEQRKLHSDTTKIKENLTEDMWIFRTVRKFYANASTNTFELAYVIAAADDSIYLSEDTDFGVKEINLNSKKSKVSYKSTSNFDGTLGECKSDCASIRRSCAGDPRVSDPTVCYTNESTCVTECHKIYKEEPVPEGTPEA